jgi:hypothetical protein
MTRPTFPTVTLREVPVTLGAAPHPSELSNTPESMMPLSARTTLTDDGLVIRLTGHEAVDYAEAFDVVVSKHADPTEPAVESMGVDDARIVADADPSLVYCTADARLVALKRHLECDYADLSDDGENRYTGPGRADYLVLTDEEADERTLESLRETVWAFRADFLGRYVPALRNSRAAKAWEKVVGDLCEDANDLVLALLGDRADEALGDAMSEDGRGHTLASYDGQQEEQDVGGVTFYVYRT